jgi:hypothetical protein
VIRRLDRRDQRGALTPAVIIMALGLLLLGGMVTDGGRQLNAKLRAQATAEEAARAGANMVDLREAGSPIEWDEARDAIAAYCARAAEADPTISECEPEDYGYDSAEGSAHEDQGWVEARVAVEVEPLLFGIIGVDNLRADVSARAYAQVAVLDPLDDVFDVDYSPSVEYPTTTVTLPEDDQTSETVIEIPTEYPTTICGEETSVPLTIGVSCSVTTIVLPTEPPPPTPTATTTSTSYTTYPTSVPPFPDHTP